MQRGKKPNQAFKRNIQSGAFASQILRAASARCAPCGRSTCPLNLALGSTNTQPMITTIFGTSKSRAFRVLWMAKELDIEFEHQPTDWRTCGKDPDYLAINPAGSIPCLKENDFILAESMAINLYLARKYPKLWPSEERDQAAALQWSFWAATSLEEPYNQWADHQHWLSPQFRKPELATAAMDDLERPLNRLETALSNDSWLLNGRFTVADLNVASVICFPSGAPLARWPHVRSWLSSCVQRPAFNDAARLP